MGEQLCPICKLNASIEPMPGRDASVVECERCGRFAMTGTLLAIVKSADTGTPSKLSPYLSAHTRQATAQNVVVMLDSKNWREYAEGHIRTPVSQKTSRLLGYLAAGSTYPGIPAAINPQLDYPLFDAGSAHEVKFLLDHLRALDYIDIGDLVPKVSAKGSLGYVVTVKGWQQLEPPSGAKGIPGRCFIAMSFHESLNDAYELGIRPAVSDCGFQPVRIDREHHNEKICDRILAEIRTAQFMVSDFTFQRAGVYFEAGFAMGLGRPVVWTCREDEFEKTHFDTRQYNHVVWLGPEDLRSKLADRIRATISG